MTQVLWLGDGIEGDDTDGHVDDITRFVGPNTVVTVVEEDEEDPNYEPLELESTSGCEPCGFPMAHRCAC